MSGEGGGGGAGGIVPGGRAGGGDCLGREEGERLGAPHPDVARIVVANRVNQVTRGAVGEGKRVGQQGARTGARDCLGRRDDSLYWQRERAGGGGGPLISLFCACFDRRYCKMGGTGVAGAWRQRGEEAGQEQQEKSLAMCGNCHGGRR